jgi:hypothetical protein
MQRVLIWYSVHKRQWRIVNWFAVATLRWSGIRLNEGRGMKMRHYLTKVGAVCDGQEDTEVALKVLQQHLRCCCGAVRLNRHFTAPFTLACLLFGIDGARFVRRLSHGGVALYDPVRVCGLATMMEV